MAKWYQYQFKLSIGQYIGLGFLFAAVVTMIIALVTWSLSILRVTVILTVFGLILRAYGTQGDGVNKQDPSLLARIGRVCYIVLEVLSVFVSISYVIFRLFF